MKKGILLALEFLKFKKDLLKINKYAEDTHG